MRTIPAPGDEASTAARKSERGDTLRSSSPPIVRGPSCPSAIDARSSRSSHHDVALVRTAAARIAPAALALIAHGAFALACGSTEVPPPGAPPAPPPSSEAAPGARPSASPSPSPSPSATAPSPAAQAPSGLICIAKHFVGKPAQRGAAWVLALPDGTELPWDDAKPKPFDLEMEQPDLQDTLSIPYAPGAITAVTAVDHDPGRIRSDVLFKATYGASAAAVQQALVDVGFVGQTVKVHARAAAALGRVSAKLEARIAQTPSLGAYVTGELGGTFAWRPIANTTRMSVHSYGAAIDIVVAKSNYWEWEKTPSGAFVWKNQIPQAVVDAFESEAFAWGGRWYHYDTMHFEYRPELFDPACAP